MWVFICKMQLSRTSRVMMMIWSDRFGLRRLLYRFCCRWWARTWLIYHQTRPPRRPEYYYKVDTTKVVALFDLAYWFHLFTALAPARGTTRGILLHPRLKYFRASTHVPITICILASIKEPRASKSLIVFSWDCRTIFPFVYEPLSISSD